MTGSPEHGGVRPPSPRLVGAGAALLILIWGTTWSAIRISLEGFAPFTGAALRFGLASVVLLGAAAVVGVRLARSRRELLMWAVQAVFPFALSYGTVYWGEQWVPSGLTSVLFSTFPIFVAILAYVLLPQERLGKLALGGVVLGFAGVAVIFSEDLVVEGDARVWIAMLVILGSPLSAAIGNVIVKRWGTGIHPLNLTAAPMGIAAGMLAALAVAVESDLPVRATTGPVLAVVYLAVVGSAVTFIVYFWLLHHIEATRLSLITYGIPIVAVTVGTIFLDEPLTPRIVLGTLLVIGGVALVLKRKR